MAIMVIQIRPSARRPAPAAHGAGRTRAGAFTLFEIVLVILIISLIGVLAVPQFEGQSSLRLGTAANVLAADIEFCEDQCVSNPNTPYSIEFNVQNNTYWIALASNPNVPIADPEDSLAYLNDFQTGRNARLAGISLRSVSIGTNGTALSPDAYGCPNLAQNAAITLSDGHSTITLSVDANTGDVTMGPAIAIPGG